MLELPNLEKYHEAYKGLEAQLQEVIANNLDPADLLIKFPFAKQDTEAYQSKVTSQYEEFTAYCPWTAFPDQGRVLLEYTPNKDLLELKSYKYYLLAFREMHITQEHFGQKLYHDLHQLLAPRSLFIQLDYWARGGIHTTFEIGSRW